MVRAKLLVQRLFAAWTIGDGLTLLVIGGRAGGTTAAMVAANLGVATTLVEQQSTLFSTQSLADRHIDPWEYDWAHLHWRQCFFPCNGASMPLPFPEMRATLVANLWNYECAV